MTESPARPRRALPVLLGAAIAGVLAGAVAVYVITSRQGNGDATVHLYDDEADAGIPAGGPGVRPGRLVIIVQGAQKTRPKIKEWWWTDRNGNRVSPKNPDPAS